MKSKINLFNARSYNMIKEKEEKIKNLNNIIEVLILILDNELKTTTSNKLLIENSLKEDVSNDSEDYKDIFSNIKHLYNDRMIYDIETLKEIFEDKLEKNKNLAGHISEEMLENYS